MHQITTYPLSNPIGSRAYTNNLSLALDSTANVSNIELFRLATVSLLGQFTMQLMESMFVYICDNPYYHSCNTCSDHNETQTPLVVTLTTIGIFYYFNELMI